VVNPKKIGKNAASKRTRELHKLPPLLDFRFLMVRGIQFTFFNSLSSIHFLQFTCCSIHLLGPGASRLSQISVPNDRQTFRAGEVKPELAILQRQRKGRCGSLRVANCSI
jgi:hypothetical protein